MLKIGLTGGIGSGKSIVASYFAKLGIKIIDADIIAREITKPNTRALKKITKHFGNNLIDKTGKLRRKKLREIIFKSTKERLWLEKLLHPLIYKKMLEQIQNCKSLYCILVLPLLYETKVKAFCKLVDQILVVDAPIKCRVARIVKRDQIKYSDAINIIRAQTVRETRIKFSDDVIKNNGSLAELQKKVRYLHRKYSSMTI
jgi:dephospho-CoA kinase